MIGSVRWLPHPDQPRAAAARHPLIAHTPAIMVTISILVASGCSRNDPAYFPGLAVLQTDGSDTEVRGTVVLPFRAPSAAEQTQLDNLSATLGYAVPWLREDRVHVEVKYTVINLSSTNEGTFSLFADGASEFTRFDYDAVAAAFAADDEEPPPLGLMQIVNAPLLKPGEVYQGIFREDDFHEASLDLDAMGRFMAPFVAVLLNRSEVNGVGLEMAPPNFAPPQQWILPALWEVTIRFSATQPMSCQFVVRVRDDEQRLWEDGAGDFAPAPATFAPVLP